MKEVYCQEVIISTQLRRGKGVEGDPVRQVTQVFTKDGTLIAEHDPYNKDRTIVSSSSGMITVTIPR